MRPTARQVDGRGPTGRLVEGAQNQRISYGVTVIPASDKPSGPGNISGNSVRTAAANVGSS
jgi:hypothetical protein